MRVVQKKICLLGDYSVGKTSLVRRFVEGRFDEKYHSTIGVTISRKTLALEGGQLNFILWDLAGGKEFARVQPSYLQGASGALIVFDLTRPETLESVRGYLEQLLASNENAAAVLVGNKLDLDDQRRIAEADLAAINLPASPSLLVTSAKSGENVEAAFLRLGDLIGMDG